LGGWSGQVWLAINAILVKGGLVEINEGETCFVGWLGQVRLG